MQEWLSWDFWDIPKSEIFRNLILSITAVFGLFFLIWRAISSDRVARAALQQAKAANAQINIATRNLSIVEKQVAISMKNIEITNKKSEHENAQRKLDIFLKISDTLINAESDIKVILSINALRQIAMKNPEVSHLVTDTLCNFARAKYFAHMPGLESKEIDISNPSKTYHGKVEFIQSIPENFWQEHRNVFIATPSTIQKTLREPHLEESKMIIDSIMDKLLRKNMILYSKYIYNQDMIHHRFPMHAIMENLKIIRGKYPNRLVNLVKTNFDGLMLSATNLNDSFLYLSTFRGASILDVTFEKAKMFNCIFDSSFLLNVNFEGVDLSESEFRSVDFSGEINMRCADIKNVVFINCFGLEQVVLRDAVNADSCIIVRDGVATQGV